MPHASIDIPVPDLTGKLAIVTGGSDGIGLHIAARLATAGAEVLLPVRNLEKGGAARLRILGRAPGARVSLRRLDLASLRSVAELAAGLRAEGRAIDILVNNAGVMNPPSRQLTEDGYELQYGTNHLGHAALTTGLLPLLRAGRARVVTQTALAANMNAVNWDDLQWARGYDAMKAYSSSKIAMALWALELDRVSAAEKWGITSNLAHPGICPTNLLAAQPGMGRTKDTAGVRAVRVLSRLGILFGTAQTAALPAVYAATNPGARGGAMYGPSGVGHLRGTPAPQELYSRLTRAEDRRRIWELSEKQLAGLDLTS